MTKKIRLHIKLLWLLLLCTAFAAQSAFAEVVAALSSPQTQVGAPVQLQYQFINTDTPQDMPRSIMVDGLDVRLTGTSRRVEMLNMQTTSSIVYTYIVLPDRPGDFVIPGFAVQAGGRQIRTQDVPLHVVGGSGGGYNQPPPVRVPQQLPPGATQQQQRRQQQAPRNRNNEGAMYFGELVMASKSAYVGEVIPVELRFYFRADAQFDNLQRPTFGGDGFTAAPLSEPEQSEQYIEGSPYNVITFRSAITPVKTGEIDIPPALMEGRMALPGGGPTGIDPFFDQFFQNFSMPGFGHVENFESKTRAKTLSVEALPKEGRPESFAGAIGQFTMSSSANPKTVDAGNPIVLKVTLEGRGNFNAITPPTLAANKGWRTYAPKENFEPADSIGFGGTKTFDYNLIAKTDQTATPEVEFSFFDPLKKKYVTLKSEPIRVTAAGSSAVANEAAADTADANKDKAKPASEPKTAATPTGTPDIAAPATTFTHSTKSFAPLLLKPWFLIVQAVVLLILIITIPIALFLRRRTRKNAGVKALQHSMNEARMRMEQSDDLAAFYSAASTFVTAQLALWEQCRYEDVQPDQALTRHISDPMHRQSLHTIFTRCDESKYGGTTKTHLDPNEKRNVMTLLSNLSSSHA